MVRATTRLRYHFLLAGTTYQGACRVVLVRSAITGPLRACCAPWRRRTRRSGGRRAGRGAAARSGGRCRLGGGLVGRALVGGVRPGLVGLGRRVPAGDQGARGAGLVEPPDR